LRGKFFIILSFIILFFISFPSLGRSEKIALQKCFISPFSTNVKHFSLPVGFFAIIIDDLNNVARINVVSLDEIFNTIKRSNKRVTSYGLYLMDIIEIAEKLKANAILIPKFYEKRGWVDIQVKLFDLSTKKVSMIQEIQGSLSQISSLGFKFILTIGTMLNHPISPSIKNNIIKSFPLNLQTMELFSKGVNFYTSGDYIEASAMFYKVTKREPQFLLGVKFFQKAVRLAENRYRNNDKKIGELYQKIGKQEKAIEKFRSVLAKDPNDADSLFYIAQILYQRGKPKEAKDVISKVLYLNPNHYNSNILLSKILIETGKIDEAISLLKKMQKNFPSDNKIIALLAVANEKSGNQKEATKSYIEAGNLAKNELMIDDSEKFIQKASMLEPNNSSILVERGKLYMRLGDYDKAAKFFKKAIMLNPENDKPYGYLGEIFEFKKGWELAEKYYYKALELNHYNEKANFYFGKKAKKEFDLVKALKFFKRASKANPLNKDIRMALAKTYIENMQYEEGIDEYNKAQEDFPYDPHVLKDFGDALLETDQIDEASIQYKKAIEIDPNYAEAYRNLGICSNKLGLKEEAEKNLSIAKQLDPNLKTNLLDIFLERFIASFPIQPINNKYKIGLIQEGVDIQKLNFSVISSWIKPYRFTPYLVKKKISYILSDKFDIVPKENLGVVLNYKDFKGLKFSDIKNPYLMKKLSQSLSADGIMFFSSYPVRSLSKVTKIKIDAYLFDNEREKIWRNNIIVDFPKKEIFQLNKPFFGLLLLLIFILGFVFTRNLIIGKGDLSVRIIQDPDQKAIFSLILSKKGDKNFTQTKRILLKSIDKRMRYTRKARYVSKYERSLVTKQAKFKRIKAGHYFLYLYGIIEKNIADALFRDAIGNYQIVKKCLIKKGEETKIVFDLNPHEAYVEFKIYYGDKIATGAEVYLEGKKNQSTFMKENSNAYLYLPPGSHIIVINYHGKLVRKKIEIHDVKDYQFVINISETEEEKIIKKGKIKLK